MLGKIDDEEQGGTTALVTVEAPGVQLVLPPLISDAGRETIDATLEFFMTRIRNPNTRAAYGRNVARFCAWATGHGYTMQTITPPVVGAYFEELEQQVSVPSSKQHLAALRNWFDWLTHRGVLKSNPTASMRGQKHSVREGKTPDIEPALARALFDSINGDDIIGLRDRALIAVMLFGFARVSAAVKMRVRDFENEGKAKARDKDDDDDEKAWLVLNEKGGKHRRIPCHHETREHLQAYIQAAGFEPRSKEPLFQTAPRHSKTLSGKPLTRIDAWEMVKRRCKAAGLSAAICNHSFRATAITIHLDRGGRLEDAQDLAGHVSPKTTLLYFRKTRRIKRAEVERVQL